MINQLQYCFDRLVYLDIKRFFMMVKNDFNLHLKAGNAFALSIKGKYVTIKTSSLFIVRETMLQ